MTRQPFGERLMGARSRQNARALGPLGLAAALAACQLESNQPRVFYVYDASPSVARWAELSNDAGLSVTPMLVDSTESAPDPGAYGVYITASGETNALSGLAFPPSDFQNGTYMVDGWQLNLRELLVNIDNITLWDNPYEAPSNPGLHGPVRALVKGPFVVDLHKGGPLIGQGGAPEQAVPFASITRDIFGHPLEVATDYGFGFSTVAASYAGYNVNLGPSQAADFDYMVEHGYSVLYVGSATWVGSASPYGCVAPQSPTTTLDAGYDFAKLPTIVNFRFGFSTPTNYVNCQNMTAQFGSAVANENYVRGIEVSSSQSAIAQITIHMDHPFWESFKENTPSHFDQIAAQYIDSTGIPDATLEDMIGVKSWAFTDRRGTPLPWRNCAGAGNYAPPTNGQMSFNTCDIAQAAPGGNGSNGVRDYYDFMRYNQATQGHLNSQGMCVIERLYAAPAGDVKCGP